MPAPAALVCRPGGDAGSARRGVTARRSRYRRVRRDGPALGMSAPAGPHAPSVRSRVRQAGAGPDGPAPARRGGSTPPGLGAPDRQSTGSPPPAELRTPSRRARAAHPGIAESPSGRAGAVGLRQGLECRPAERGESASGRAGNAGRQSGGSPPSEGPGMAAGKAGWVSLRKGRMGRLRRGWEFRSAKRGGGFREGRGGVAPAGLGISVGGERWGASRRAGVGWVRAVELRGCGVSGSFRDVLESKKSGEGFRLSPKRSTKESTARETKEHPRGSSLKRSKAHGPKHERRAPTRRRPVDYGPAAPGDGQSPRPDGQISRTLGNWA